MSVTKLISAYLHTYITDFCIANSIRFKCREQVKGRKFKIILNGTKLYFPKKGKRK